MDRREDLRDDYRRLLRRRLLSTLPRGEDVLAEGRLRGGFTYVLVTPRRVVVAESGRDVSLPFERITGAEEIVEETHRYALRLEHRAIRRPRDRLLRRRVFPWDLAAHWRSLRRWRRQRHETVLRFSRRDTEAATAVRERVRSFLGDEVFAGPPTVRPHQRDPGYLVRID